MTERTITITLTERQLVLVRVALIQRLTRLKAKDWTANEPHLKRSHDDTLAMLEKGGVLYRAMRDVGQWEKPTQIASWMMMGEPK